MKGTIAHEHRQTIEDALERQAASVWPFCRAKGL